MRNPASTLKAKKKAFVAIERYSNDVRRISGFVIDESRPDRVAGTLNLVSIGAHVSDHDAEVAARKYLEQPLWGVAWDDVTLV